MEKSRCKKTKQVLFLTWMSVSMISAASFPPCEGHRKKRPSKPGSLLQSQMRPISPPWAPSVASTASWGTAGGCRGAEAALSLHPGSQLSVLFHKLAWPRQEQRDCISSGEHSVPLPWECLSCSNGGILALG